MNIMGADPTRAYASTEVPDFKVGTLYTDANGNVFQFVKADGTGITQYFLAAINTAAGVATMPINTSTFASYPCGVAQATIAANGWGWLEVKGVSLLQVSASCAAGVQINTTATAGQLDDDATAGAEVINGIALLAARGGTAGTANAIITYPTVGRTL